MPAADRSRRFAITPAGTALHMPGCWHLWRPDTGEDRDDIRLLSRRQALYWLASSRSHVPCRECQPNPGPDLRLVE